MLPVYDEYSAIVYAMNSKNVRSSMVNGDWIMRNRIVCHVDKENTLEAIKQLSGQQQLPVTLAGIQAGHTEVTED